MFQTKQVSFTIILATQITHQADQLAISNVINSFHSISEWSHDLEDSDKILRIISSNEISKELVLKLKESGINSSIMEIFDKAPEIRNNLNYEWAALLQRIY